MINRAFKARPANSIRNNRDIKVKRDANKLATDATSIVRKEFMDNTLELLTTAAVWYAWDYFKPSKKKMHAFTAGLMEFFSELASGRDPDGWNIDAFRKQLKLEADLELEFR